MKQTSNHSPYPVEGKEVISGEVRFQFDTLPGLKKKSGFFSLLFVV